MASHGDLRGVSLAWVSRLALLYAALAFGWSAFGFVSPTTPIHLHEYPLSGLAVEIGGHLIFGLLAVLPALDPSLILLGGAESILIDSDHFLSAFGLPVETRAAHSISFIILAPLIMGIAAARGKRPSTSVVLVTFSALMAHLSYDIFAGNGFVPLLAPFNLAFFPLPDSSWPAFEAAGLLASLLVWRLNQRRHRTGANA